MPLTDAQCRAAKPAEKVQKLSDSRGLFLQVTLLHKSADARSFPIPGQTHPVTFVMGVPSAVKPLSTATLTWNSAT
jgi:hypothetical protein